MPIQMVKETVRLPLLGTIRLGEKTESRTGSKYPVEREYFILREAPDVALVYGDEPKELDILFPSDDLELVLPTWYKWYSAAKTNANGDVIGGTLNCYGDGPSKDGTPGEAIFLREKDRITGIPPKRACRGKDCPDYFGPKGIQQCKQSMQVYCVLPRVSLGGVYKIHTSSWNAIFSFHNKIRWTMLQRGSIRGMFFKIKRNERSVPFFDKKTGTDATRTHYIMELEDNQTFDALYGNIETRAFQAAIVAGHAQLPEQQLELEAPSPLAYRLPPPEVVAEEKAKDRLEIAREISQDPTIQRHIEMINKLSGKPLSEKQIMAAILKRCEAPDWKQAVIESLVARENELHLEHTKLQLEQVNEIAQPTPEVPTTATTEPAPEAALEPEVFGQVKKPVNKKPPEQPISESLT